MEYHNFCLLANIFSSGNDAAALANLTMAINDYHKYTCLRFKRRTDEVTYILFYQGQGYTSVFLILFFKF